LVTWWLGVVAIEAAAFTCGRMALDILEPMVRRWLVTLLI
jgi:hypothetical protein